MGMEPNLTGLNFINYWTSEYIDVGAVSFRWMTEVKGQCCEGRWMNGLVGKWKVRWVNEWVCKWWDLKDRWMNGLEGKWKVRWVNEWICKW